MKKFDNVDRATADSGRVRVGAAWTLLPHAPASVQDSDRVKVGAAWRLLPRS